jgi:hypothetical protein
MKKANVVVFIAVLLLSAGVMPAAEPKKDAKGNFPRSKILTYDGVHMLPTGNDLIAQYVSKGILDALQAAR